MFEGTKRNILVKSVILEAVCKVQGHEAKNVVARADLTWCQTAAAGRSETLSGSEGIVLVLSPTVGYRTCARFHLTVSSVSSNLKVDRRTERTASTDV